MTKEQQIKIQRCIDEFYSNRPQVRDELGAALQVLYEAEPIKHGRWLPSDKGDCTYICSECGFVRDAYILEEKAYCPRCGADMRERREDG